MGLLYFIAIITQTKLNLSPYTSAGLQEQAFLSALVQTLVLFDFQSTVPLKLKSLATFEERVK